VGRYANKAVARRTIQEVQSVYAQPPQPLARAEGVCWNIYLGNVYIIYLSHPGEKTGKLSAKNVVTYK
jgi:hypothetical protein